jgi:signal transduction histidine kinase
MIVQSAIDLIRRALAGDPEAGARTGRPPSGPRPATERALSHLGKAEKAVVRMAEIVAGMNVSQRRTSATATADLAEVVRLSVACLHAPLRRRGALRVDLAAVPAVKGSPTALGQVVLNLLVNALEALPPDGGPGSVVTIRLSHDGDEAVLEVEDTGVGIAPDLLDRVFDPFFTTKEDGGTGLGLAISRRIVDEIGGSIRVASEPGDVTRFTVRLPLVPPAAGAASA